MDLWDAVGLLGKRWPVLAFGVALTVGVVGAMAVALPPTYSDSGTVMLLPPVSGGTYQPGQQSKLINPYLSLDSSLYVFASTVGDALNRDETKQSFRDDGYTATYEVVLKSDAPTLVVTATGHDPQMVLATRDQLVARIESEVVSRQADAGAPESTWITTRVDNRQPKPSQTTQKLKVLGIAAGLGLAAAVSLVFAVEGLGLTMPGRRRKRAGPSNLSLR